MEPTEIPVTAVMSDAPSTIPPDTPLPEIFEQFSRTGCTDIVVSGPEGRFLGFITALDLLTAVGHVIGVRSRRRTTCIDCLLRGDTAVAADIMTRGHITIPDTATVREAMEAMERYRYPVLVVVDRAGSVVGRIEVCMIIAHLRIAGHL